MNSSLTRYFGLQCKNGNFHHIILVLHTRKLYLSHANIPLDHLVNSIKGIFRKSSNRQPKSWNHIETNVFSARWGLPHYGYVHTGTISYRYRNRSDFWNGKVDCLHRSGFGTCSHGYAIVPFQNISCQNKQIKACSEMHDAAHTMMISDIATSAWLIDFCHKAI